MGTDNFDLAEFLKKIEQLHGLDKELVEVKTNLRHANDNITRQGQDLSEARTRLKDLEDKLQQVTNQRNDLDKELAVTQEKLNNAIAVSQNNSNVTNQNNKLITRNPNARLSAFLAAMLLLLSSLSGSLGINKITSTPPDAIGGVFAIIGAFIAYTIATAITFLKSEEGN